MTKAEDAREAKAEAKAEATEARAAAKAAGKAEELQDKVDQERREKTAKVRAFKIAEDTEERAANALGYVDRTGRRGYVPDGEFEVYATGHGGGSDSGKAGGARSKEMRGRDYDEEAVTALGRAESKYDDVTQFVTGQPGGYVTKDLENLRAGILSSVPSAVL